MSPDVLEEVSGNDPRNSRRIMTPFESSTSAPRLLEGFAAYPALVRPDVAMDFFDMLVEMSANSDYSFT